MRQWLCLKKIGVRSRAEDYINVGQTIITKYPFLKSPVGSPVVCFLSFVKY